MHPSTTGWLCRVGRLLITAIDVPQAPDSDLWIADSVNIVMLLEG